MKGFAFFLLALLGIDAYDAVLDAPILKYTKSASTLPILFSCNVVETDGGCCVVGYHSVVQNHGEPQPYVSGAYTDACVFPAGEADIWARQHELGEVFNDPYLKNRTPGRETPGHPPCRTNLEVGDPLFGTTYELTENGFTYHPQELVFFSWFFGQDPSIGTGARYSYKGTFSSLRGICA